MRTNTSNTDGANIKHRKKEIHRELNKLTKTTGEEGIFIQIIGALWKSKCMPSFSKNTMVKICYF